MANVAAMDAAYQLLYRSSIRDRDCLPRLHIILRVICIARSTHYLRTRGLVDCDQTRLVILLGTRPRIVYRIRRYALSDLFRFDQVTLSCACMVSVHVPTHCLPWDTHMSTCTCTKKSTHEPLVLEYSISPV